MAASGSNTSDPRRLAVDGRLRRLKQGLVAATVAAWLLVWTLVAGSIPAPQAANAQAPESHSLVTEPDRFFAPTGASPLGSATGREPLLRSGGS